MVVIDFSEHVAKGPLPVRSVRICPGGRTPAATFGEQSRVPSITFPTSRRVRLAGPVRG
jgi:hypothetical protein